MSEHANFQSQEKLETEQMGGQGQVAFCVRENS